MKIKNIIFDWSGTLVDDLPAVWRATNEVFQKAGVPELSLDEFRKEFQLPFNSFYQRFLPDVDMEQLEIWFHGSFREKQDLVDGLPHAREFLRFCRDRHVRTFVLSTASNEHYQVQASKTGYGKYIDRPYLGVWDKRKRINAILKENDLHPDETLFIGDMEHDIDTAKHGGVRSCGVLTGYNKMHQLKAAEPDVLVEHLGELRERLQRDGMRLAKNGSRSDSEHPVPTVGAAIYNDEGKLLLIRTQKWSHKWGIPGGKIHRGETAEAAIIREVKEETNLVISGLRFIEQQDVIDPSEFYRAAHFILLNFDSRAHGLQQVLLNDEGEDWNWFEPKQALELDLNHPSRRLLEKLGED
ncbi:MAG: NUDIX hydrolase [Verrucomicrobiales bacterium]|nr:NUDIX hydrolase [Verrucomicrobiales bacterium]